MTSVDHGLDTAVAGFLKDVKQTVQDNKGSFASPPHLVLGNPAGDADSIVSAIGWAYVESTVGKSQYTPRAVIPVIPIAAQDLRSQRPETTFLLTTCAGLDPDLNDLISIDQPEFLPHEATLTLVDHNHHFDIQTTGQTWTVTEIVDHHQDDRQHLETCPPGPKRNVAFQESQALVASTCTLVVEQFYALTDDRNIAMPPSLAILLLGVILLDSINMLPQAGKGTPRDGAAIKRLLEDTSWVKLPLPEGILSGNSVTPDPTKLFECLQAQKFSPEFWAGLTALQGIRLDYKSFPVPSYSSPGASSSLGIATILQDMDTFWKKDNVVQTLASFAAENDLEMLGLMFTFMEGDKDGGNKKPRRQLTLASANKQLMTDFLGFLSKEAKEEVDLELTTMEEMTEEDVSMGGRTSKVYIAKLDQGNSKASRKQVAPVLSNFWKSRGYGSPMQALQC
jgi:exopolyphosphatase